MTKSTLPLPCRRLRQIDASVCTRKEGCSAPLGQTGCFTRILAEHAGALSRVLTTGYRLWEEGKSGDKRALIASPLFQEPLPDCSDARDPALITAGVKAVNNAARSISWVLHTARSNGRNYDSAEEGEGPGDRPVRDDMFYGVRARDVEEESRRKVGRAMLGE